MTIPDNVHAAARTLAQLTHMTHMTQDGALHILNLLVEMDQQALATMPEQERATVGTLPAMLTALCGTELAEHSQTCAGWQQLRRGR